MKCSIIRDLLPQYALGKCSKVTEEVVTQHLKNCQSCNRLYTEMQVGLGLEEFVLKDQLKQNSLEDKDFWREYYGKFLKKGIMIFIVIYIVALMARLLKLC